MVPGRAGFAAGLSACSLEWVRNYCCLERELRFREEGRLNSTCRLSARVSGLPLGDYFGG